jgi:NADH-quinone oxidoreductase subunit L
VLYAVAVFAPLLGAIIAGLLGRQIGDKASQAVTILCMAVAACCGIASFIPFIDGSAEPGVLQLGTWISVDGFDVDWSLRYDALSCMMVAMVTFVATLIHIYSVGYMSHDATIPRFFSYLSLFCFAMLMLVTADSLVQLFFGWEGVGLASYLLIGYWYDRPSACRAAMKAFIVNRVGDLFFATGIACVFFVFGSVNFQDIFANIPQHQNDLYHLFGHDLRAYEVIGVLLFLGAMGKSAQIGLHTWLPDAMEGPTPVSALIHAATMVTAGVFLMARMSPLLEYAPYALGFVTFIGATTCLFAATIGCVQNDIKRIIAYSTCSQLGYMFIAAGVGAFQVSVFHLFNHAFFKALLFLSAGSVIHAMSDEQDIRKMGGLARVIPVTCTVMWIGSLALAGIPPFAGYFSKDAILEAAWANHTGLGQYGFWCGTIAAFLTAFYSWRLLILTFHGKTRADHHTIDHAHESPAVMLGPLIMLAAGAILTGFLFKYDFIGEGWHEFWGASIFNRPGNTVMEAMEHVPTIVSILPTIMGVLGIALAYLMYMITPSLPARMANAVPGVYRFVLNKWYFDELYDRIFVRPVFWLANFLWKTGDGTLIDGVPNGIAALTVDGSAQAVRIQTGSIAVYAFTMLIGLVALVSIFLVFR